MKMDYNVPAGYKVRFFHWRFVNLASGEKALVPFSRKGHDRMLQPESKGGKTMCKIYNNDRILMAVGFADCSKNDVFCYQTGRNLAFNRAMEDLNDWEL
jgi:hypothetical protein